MTVEIIVHSIDVIYVIGGNVLSLSMPPCSERENVATYYIDHINRVDL